MRTQLRANEELILEVRKHWLSLNPALNLLSLWMVGGAVVCIIVHQAVWYVGLSFVLPLLYLGYAVLNRRVDIWAVTNQRVLDEWGVFSHGLKESPLTRIHNITCWQSLLGRMLGYGTVEIQTAAEQGATRYHYVSDPQQLTRIISDRL